MSEKDKESPWEKARKKNRRSKNFIWVPPPVYKWSTTPVNQKEREAILNGGKKQRKTSKGSE